MTPQPLARGPLRGALPGRQGGLAMLVAILLVALGTILAAAIAYESAMSARRSTATFDFDEALLVDQGAEALAAIGLRTTRQLDKTGTIYITQPWAHPVGPVEVVPGLTLQASLEDLQGRFNLNSLVVSGSGGPGQVPGQVPGQQEPSHANPQTVLIFQRLLQFAGIEPKWADLLVDWIDPDNQPLPDGAEDNAYLSQNPPYLTANLYITSTTELLALPGFGADRYRKIAPYITALPPTVTQVNICTAAPVVLDALMAAAGPGPERAEFSLDPDALAKNRANAAGCFPSQQDYQAALGPAAAKVMPFVTTNSHYFRLSSLVTIGTAEFNLYSLLYQDDSGGMVHTVLRSYSPD
ncbi:MAG TPA: type II secretion system minor pseudopilin GspK [Steroidobacteraceae bacterium]|nr:type II secretion system minor pseudopilin GspK [Steroidobacteraceae bacterium]